jgi:hypothetical protein
MDATPLLEGEATVEPIEGGDPSGGP